MAQLSAITEQFSQQRQQQQVVEQEETLARNEGEHEQEEEDCDSHYPDYDYPTSSASLGPQNVAQHGPKSSNAPSEASGASMNAPPSQSLPISETRYFFPDTCVFLDDHVKFQDLEFYPDAGDIEFGHYNGRHSFRPLVNTEAVQTLIDDSSRVVIRKDVKDNKAAHFNCLALAVNTGGYQHFGISSSRLQHQTIVTEKVFHFPESIKNTYTTSPPYTHKPMPFLVVSGESSDTPNKLLLN